jgi:DNA-binding XRE family transcriptional regulator
VRTFLSRSKVIKKPNVPQYNPNPHTIGEHIRKKRIESRLPQKDLAAILKVTEDCITGWEKGRNEPRIRYYPRIIEFLGYYPFEHETETLGGKLEKARRCNGWTYRRLGNALGVDGSTARRWGSTISHASKQSTRNADTLVRQFLAKQSPSI